MILVISPKSEFLSFFWEGGSDEENYYVGNGFGDDAFIDWRMLAMVV
jgi:hypothetical protein